MATRIEQTYNELQDIKKAQSEAQKIYQEFAGSAPKVPFMVQDELKKRLDYNKPIIEEENRLKADRRTTPADYAAELKGGRFAGDPILAGQAAVQRQAAIDRRIADIQGVRQEREGTMANIINAASAGFQGEVEARKVNLDGLRERYGITFNEYQQLEQEEQQRLQNELQRAEQEERKRQFDVEQDLAERKFQESLKPTVSRSGGGGGGSSRGASGSGNGLGEISQAMLDRAIKIIKSPGLSNNPTEAASGKGDAFLDFSRGEGDRAVEALATAFSLDEDSAYDLFNRAWTAGGFQEWTGSEDQWKSVGGRPATYGPAY